MIEVNSLSQELKPFLGWHQARISLLAQFILALIKVRTTNLTQLAQAFSGNALSDSNYKRLQRFLRWFDIDFDKMALVIGRLFCSNGKWVLSLDRTNWKFGSLDINFLVLAVCNQGIAIPIMWCLLPKQGNSNTMERQALVNRFLHVFGVEKIEVLTADREFKGKDWLSYLADKQIPFCLRIPKNTQVINKHRNQRLPVYRMFSLRANEQMTLSNKRHVWGIPVHISCIMGPKGRVIVICNDCPQLAIRRYRERWSIETLFGCLKTRGFDLEATHLVDLERISKLFFVVTLAFGFCFKLGIWAHKNKKIPIKSHGRRAKSIFRVGLDLIREYLLNPYTNSTCFNQLCRVLSCT